MIDTGAWEAFGGVAAVVVLLGGLALALQRLGVIRRPAPPAPAADKDTTIERFEAIEKEQARLAGVIEALPEARELRALAESAAVTRGDVKAVRASLDGIEKMVQGLGRQVAAINHHLLRRER